jgi:hypothetical protein
MVDIHVRISRYFGATICFWPLTVPGARKKEELVSPNGRMGEGGVGEMAN